MGTQSHSVLINKAARDLLKPIGVFRKGQSRIWLDDNGWWVTIVEFQPSRWSKGTYLNVGVCWQWYPKDDYSFDLGYREHDFVEFENESNFSFQVSALVNKAKECIWGYRDALCNPSPAKNFILDNTIGGNDHIWASINKGMACLHARSFEQSEVYFNIALNCCDNRDWATSAKEFIKPLVVLSPEEKISYVRGAIKCSRKLKMLNEVDDTFGNSI